jgi:hypothetical protein
MRSITRLLFGPDGDKIADLFAPGDHDEHGMAERVRESGEWCQTTLGGSRIRSRPLPSLPTVGPRRGRG